MSSIASSAGTLDTSANAQSTRDTWRYPEEAETRDWRIDFLRGLAIVFVVVDHIELNSAFYLLSHERIGVVSGAELFVLLSGLVLGMVHRNRSLAAGWSASASRMWGRARLLYLISLAVVVSAYLVSKLPFLDGDVLTTWTDNATGQVYSLYGSTPLLREYPVPPPAVFDVLFLSVGPYQFNVMGLYVVLLLLAPLGLWLMLTNRWWLLLAGSATAYALSLLANWHILPSAFANSFPLLSWQFLFVIGLVAGFHHKAIRAWFSQPTGNVVIGASVLAFIAFALFSWNNPGKLSDPWGLRLDMISDARFWQVYENWFRRDFLGVLRVVNVLVVVIASYALLTRMWTPMHRILGWFLVPLGGATLYVFILHIAFALAVGSMSFIQRDSLFAGTLTHAVVLMLLWVMVKTRFLYRWIPR